MRNLVNWLLIGAGGIMIVVELLLGAATGFDLALVGVALVLGGAAGLAAGSIKVGLFTAGLLSLVYVAFIRRRVRNRLMGEHRASNVDAVVGKAATVLVRVSAREAGEVKVDDEIWRAVLSAHEPSAREPGDTVTVESVEGVTLTVR